MTRSDDAYEGGLLPTPTRKFTFLVNYAIFTKMNAGPVIVFSSPNNRYARVNPISQIFELRAARGIVPGIWATFLKSCKQHIPGRFVEGSPIWVMGI